MLYIPTERNPSVTIEAGGDGTAKAKGYGHTAKVICVQVLLTIHVDQKVMLLR